MGASVGAKRQVALRAAAPDQRLPSQRLPSRRLPSQRLPGLDLLRAIAISWVLLYHASIYDLVPDGSPLVDFGWMGVDLFFTLSGFLIGSQLFRPMACGERLDFGRFYLRRALRTLPAYLVVVGVYFAWPAARETPAIQPLWQFLSFTENLFIQVSHGKAFSHVWSLCVEEQFYLVFPLVVALLALRPRWWKTAAASALVLLGGMALRGVIWMHVATPHHGAAPLAYMEGIYYPTWTRLDDLLGGVLAAAVRCFYPRRWDAALRRPNATLALGILGVAASTVFFHDQIPDLVPAVLGYPLLALCLTLTVAAASSERCIIGRYRVPGAGALATGAYSIYLSHKMLFRFVQVHFASALAPYPLAGLVVAVLVALAVGAALYWGVERPFLRLRDRLDGRVRHPVAHSPDSPRLQQA